MLGPHVRALLSTLVATVMLLAGACMGPDPARVAAERDRWTAVHDVAADGAIDDQEAPLLAQLLVEWDTAIGVDEEAAGRPRDWQGVLIDLVRIYGSVLVLPEIERNQPELARFLDANGDHVLDAAEIRRIDPRDPVFATVVATTLVELIRKPKNR